MDRQDKYRWTDRTNTDGPTGQIPMDRQDYSQ